MENKKLISEEELLKEIKSIISDELVALYSEEENKLLINFLNGQKFYILVKEKHN